MINGIMKEKNITLCKISRSASFYVISIKYISIIKDSGTGGRSNTPPHTGGRSSPPPYRGEEWSLHRGEE